MASRLRPASSRRRVTHRAILDSLGTLVYAHDLQGRLLYCNTRAAKALGYDGADVKRLRGTPFFDFIAPGARGVGAEMMRRGAQNPLDVHAFRIDVRRKDGAAVTLDIQASPLWLDGTVIGRVGVARVVDAHREAIEPEAIERAVRAERERIARALRERVPELFGEAAEHPMAAKPGDTEANAAADAFRRHGLDDTDLAILRLVTRGASNPEIGRQVHLSAEGVKDRIGRLMRRLGARRRAELSAQALRAGIV